MANDFRGKADAPKGIRNNNPGNLIDDGTAWKGKVGNDGHFIIFEDVGFGIRASLLDYHTKIVKDDLTDIQSIITKYAPANENNTSAYIAAVSKFTGLGATDDVDTTSQGAIAFIKAIYDVENGTGEPEQYITDQDYSEGMARAQTSLNGFFSAGRK